VEEIISYPLEPPEIRAGYAGGIISGADHHFGGATANVSIEDFERAGFSLGDRVLIEITHGGTVVFRGDVLYQKSFGFVGLGEPILYNGSTGYMIIGLNQASFVDKYGLEAGADWKVRFERV
jgi:S-adenosylmethionine hydrolase